MQSGGRLSKLDSLRGLAAVYVFLYHFRLLDDTRLWVVLNHGPEAVMLFFILSGFVIYYATHREQERRGSRLTFRHYFNRRVRRIYPIFLLALVVGYALYAHDLHRWRVTDARTVVGNLLMLQDAGHRGNWVGTFPGIPALWSLSYEWWFYIMFWPLWRWTAGARWQRLIVFGLSAGAFAVYEVVPNQACLFVAYFFIWWTGVELAKEYVRGGRITWRGQWASLVLLGALVALWAIPAARVGFRAPPLSGAEDLTMQFRHMAAAWVILAVGLGWYWIGFPLFRMILGPLRWVAPISYSLYLLHEPVIRSGHYFAEVHNVGLQLLLYANLLFCLCYVVEIKLQPVLARVVDRLIPPEPRAARLPTPAVAADLR